MTTTTTSSSKGSPNSDDKNTSTSNYLQDDEDDRFTFRSRKSYPQRNNRSKLNYRDLERGVYDAYEFRQSSWALGGPTVLDKNNRNKNHTEYSDDEDMPTDEENDDLLVEDKNKSNDDSDQIHRRLWCICKKPWDHSRLMLRCDSCANWYHGDCIGVTKEQARVLEMNGDQLVCPPCQKVTTNSGIKPGRSSDESIMIKRKRIDAVSPIDRRVRERNENSTSSKILTNSEPLKRPKTGIFFQRDTSTEPQIHCIVHGCSNWAKSGWVYCSPACIRRHINDTLQAIQRSKSSNNDNPPSREDILLYENRTKKVLDRKLVPKVEDLCTWINQHPSYEIVKPALRQSILLTANESKSSSSATTAGLIRSTSINTPTTPKTPTTPISNKPKLSWAPVVPNTKPTPIKKAPVQLGRQISNTSSSSTTTSTTTQNYADIRMKVPQALCDKLLMRLEKSGEKTMSKDDLLILADKIEEEMYRVYGKVDNSYKNKFRSLLANVSNMNNNFFYKHILSKEVTAKQIVAMKPEDMLPPEEKEKRKDEFEKEVQMIIKAGEQSAEEMARRARTKNTRQGLVDNDAVLSTIKTKEQTKTEPEDITSKELKAENNDTPTKPVVPKLKKPNTLTTGQKPVVKPKPKVEINKDTTSSHGRHTFDINCSLCTNPTGSKVTSPKPSTPPTEPIPPPIVSLPSKPSEELPSSLKLPSPPSPSSREETNPTFSSVDLDNDYIEPESPTGIDALLYDDDDDFNSTNTHSRQSSIQHQSLHSDSPSDNHEYLPPTQSTVRDDYNPLAASKPKTDSTSGYQPTPISRVSTQWRGIILPPDTKLSCQSVRIYGESDYLIGDIPEQLGILGRLKIAELWNYVLGSLVVRDVIVLTLISSNSNDNNAFLRYIDTLRSSGRAAVINKRTEPSLIRDMYVLAADLKDCPSDIISAFSLPSNIDSKQLFLVIIGSGKRSIKSSTNNLTYKPVSLQDTTTAAPATRRDPRLIKNKDPRLATETISTKISNDDLIKLISDSTERFVRTNSDELKQSIIISTMETLKSNEREDLCKQFANEIARVASLNTTNNTEDNLNEENMEVDDEQDKRQLAISEYNDVDYRFLDQDMDHRMPGIMMSIDETHKGVSTNDHDADDRTIKSNLINDERTKKSTNDSDFRTSDTKLTSPR